MKKNKNSKKTAEKSKTVTVPIVAARKPGAGRPKGTNTTTLIAAESLRPLLEKGGLIPINTRFAKALRLSGTTFISSAKNVADIAKNYQTQSANTNAATVTDLNESSVPA